MAETETALTEASDSPETAATAATGDTAATEGHTSAADDSEAHLAWLQANAEKIPVEKLSFLDKKFQPTFNRRLNLLNTEKQNLLQNARQMADKVGVEIPPDLDIFSSEGQKAFAEAIDKASAERLKPVLDFADQQRSNQQMATYAQIATQEPIVKEFADGVGQVLASDPELAKLASYQDWAALPLVAQGIAYKLKTEKLEGENRQLKALLEKASVAARTGKTTSRAGGPTNTGETTGRMKLAEAVVEAAKRQQGAA